MRDLSPAPGPRCEGLPGDASFSAPAGTLRARAWALLCDVARLRGADNRGVAPIAFRMAEQITGRPWADCLTPEWELVVGKLGVGA